MPAYYEMHEPPHCPTCNCGVPESHEAQAQCNATMTMEPVARLYKVHKGNRCIRRASVLDGPGERLVRREDAVRVIERVLPLLDGVAGGAMCSIAAGDMARELRAIIDAANAE